MKPRDFFAAGFVVVMGLFASSGLQAAESAGTDLLQQARQIFKALPQDMGTPENPLPPARVELGRMLFFETRVSIDGTVGCVKCHQPFLYGTDGLPRAIGVKDRVGAHNAPTILNAAVQMAAHWTGNRKDVEDQAMQALIGPGAYGNPSYDAAMARINAIPGYRAMFEKAFPNEKDPVTPANWGKAIGAYERTLVSRSRFDAYLAGDAKVLTTNEQSGLRKFIGTGCIACHNGVGIGGGMYQKFGVVEEYWNATASKTHDEGRFGVTKQPSDMYVFKVSSLRNVARTPPYFHDGSVASLPEAVKVMARVQLGKTLPDADTDDIVAFLNSLTGTLPKEFATVPELPPAAFQ